MRYKRRINEKRRVKIICITVIVLGLLSLFVYYSNKNLSPYIRDICVYNGKQEVTRVITSTADRVMFYEEDTANDFVYIVSDSAGNVKSIQTNTAKLNVIENEILSEINATFTQGHNIDVKIPLGTTTGIYAFANKGFNVKLRLMPLTNVKSEIVSEFKTAGINQTIHRIVLRISADTTMIMPFFKETSAVSVDYILAETLIVGEVPLISPEAVL